MSSLARLLRLRSLLEDVSRAALQSEASRARQIETALQSHETGIAAARVAGFDALLAAETPLWLMAEATREVGRWQVKQLKPLLERQRQRVDAAEQAYFEKRRERRQVETVLHAQRQARELEQARREQQQMDEWHASRAVALKQRAARHLR